MLYFAYGSNLYHKQMKKRCKDSVYIRCYILKNYRLFFRNNFLGGGVADIQRKNKSKVLGALYKISKRDEKKLDVYEDFPNTYVKRYFTLLGKKVMFYYMPKKCCPLLWLELSSLFSRIENIIFTSFSVIFVKSPFTKPLPPVLKYLYLFVKSLNSFILFSESNA